MDDESSDILGQQTKPVLRGSKSADSHGVSLAVKLVFGFVILFVLYVVAMRIWFRILVWRERSYKLATRRRHGIPDNDHRPFNVAYAAVLRARQQEKDVAQKASATQPVLSSDRRNVQSEQNIRQRFGLQTTAGEAPRALSYSSRFPGAYLAEGTPVRSHTDKPSPVIVGGGRYPSQSRRYEAGPPSYLNGSRRASKIGHESENGYGGQKRGFAEEPMDELENAQGTQHDDWLIGDEADGSVWQDQVPPQRGAKRYLFEEDENEDNLVERQSRGKRQRKVSLDKGTWTEGDDLDMDIDEEDDEIDDLPYILRGKKRDRAEAGSTFGGDDDDSGIELDSPGSKPKRHTRKRRTFSKRKSDIDVAARGQKRDRDMDDEEIDLESGDENSYVLRKKRGKKTFFRDDELSEHSAGLSQASSGSRSRSIGEEWSSNGIRWKVGPNGQRLRQALVRRATQKFTMPEDSQHPDRSVDFEVYVETWLTDEEYRDAKQRHILAGQDTPQRSDAKPALDVQTQTNGKNLLWSSSSVPLESPISRSPVSERALGVNQRIIRTSLTSNTPRTNPFKHVPAHSTRRISAISRAPSLGIIASPGLTDSTNSSPHTRYKTYSKLEKQELEAQALLKLRELKSKKEAESTQAKNERAAKGTASFSIPTITITTPLDASKSTPQPPRFSSPKPAEAILKSAEVPKPPSTFPFPSSTDSAKPTAAIQSSLFPTTSMSAFPSAPSSTATKVDDKPSAAPSFFPLTTLSVPAPSSSSGITPTTARSEGKPEQSTHPSISFNLPGTTLSSNPNTASVVPQSNTTSRPLFPLGAASHPTHVAASGLPSQPPTSQSTSDSPSLFSRLNPTQSNTASSTAAANPHQSNSFNVSKPNTETTTPASSTTSNPFATSNPQPTTQPTSSDSSTAGNQLKFKFNFTGPTSTSPNTSTATNVNPAPAAPPRPSMVTFTPLTPGGGTKDPRAGNNVSDTSKPGAHASPFGFKAPASSTNSDSSKPPTSVFGASGGTSNPFGTTGPSNTTSTFGGTTFGTKPAETKPMESSSTQTTKPLFNFGVTGGQASSAKDTSQTPPSMFGTSAGTPAATAAKPAPTSSSLFGALGPQTTSTFGTTSTPGTANTSGSTNVFGTTLATPSSTSTPTNVFGSNTAGASSGSASTNIFGTGTSTSSGTQPSNIFGSAGTSNGFGVNNAKPTEAPKSVFGVASAPATNGTTLTATTTEQEKPTFKFQLPASNSNGTNDTGSSGMVSTSSSGPQFTFNFGMPKNSSGSGLSQTPVFGATSGGQSAFSAKPNAFNVGSTFGSGSGSSSFNPLGTASQTNTSEQK
ncbi:hypothetical protein D9756_000288 [Leucocoprinus leucothites]|uniref:Uncharacterized protein n=1 Tax=Leucocoprinus leucothites TaxID=201217 RepID=A0A8H5LNM0_9AGAR|nr:hypothetical protein D9756_000288 [Leucoagaricus leucothites]